MAARGALTIAALVALAPAGPAAAQAMRVGELGLMTSRAACLETAAKVLAAYLDEYGGFATSGDPASADEWAIYGWGLRPGENDVVITCPTVIGNTGAFYTVHATGETAASDADTVAERLRALWESLY